jgi:kinesin family protein 2/24
MRAKSENDKGAVAFVHGVAEDTSWGAQVDRLREENQAEHELFAGHCFQAVDEEMRIRVIIRKRPMSNSEASNSKEVDVIHPLEYDDYGRILVYQPKTRVDLTKEIEQVPFSFDNVFDENSSNKQIYDRSVRNLVPGVFEGKWASVFAYGQTGSGKTYTMLGSNLTGHNAGNATSDDDNLGLYYMAALDVFELANRPENQHLQVGASLFEIYGGKLFDLLNDRKPVKCLENHKGKVCFPGLSERPVSNADELMDVIETGAMNRSTGSTSKNADSSRSHAILQLSLRKDVGRQKNVEHGRLTFIDLAGSERGADTSQASRATRLEGAEINTSLLALKEVIRALATGDSMSHIPFRGSKLTQVLKESFVGKNSRSVMVACIAPNISNCEHTLNTLRYADRVKERNPETGNLSANVLAAASPKRTRRFSRSASVPAAFGETSAPSSIASYEAESESAHERSYDDSEALLNAELEGDDEAEVSYGDSDDLLDDLLRNTPHKVHATSTSNERNNSQPKSIESDKSSIKNGKDKRFETLVSTHRSVMTEMLGMVKQEMALVNKADSDRDTIDEYMAELDILHQKQLSMIQSVEESLLDYYESRGVSIGASEDHAADELGDLLSDDDSFDDLRD